MLATRGFTPLLVDPKTMTAKPKAGGGSRNGVTCKTEKTITKDYSTDLGKSAAADGELPNKGRGAALLQTSWQIFERFLESLEKKGRMPVLYIQDAVLLEEMLHNT